MQLYNERMESPPRIGAIDEDRLLRFAAERRRGRTRSITYSPLRTRRSSSLFLIVSRLSWSFLPRAMPISIFKCFPFGVNREWDGRETGAFLGFEYFRDLLLREKEHTRSVFFVGSV